MADKNAAVINSDEIQVFPTVNSRDNGKLLLEENVSEIVNKITKLNFMYEYPKDPYITIFGNDEFTYFYIRGLNGRLPVKCNINGYTVSFNQFPSITFYRNRGRDIDLYNNDKNPQKLLINVDEFEINPDYPDKSDYEYRCPVGLVLSRMATTDRLKGDKFNNDTKKYFYYGVEVKAGLELMNSDKRDTLILGWLCFKHKDPSEDVAGDINITGLINPNIFYIIDGNTVTINNYSLPDYLSGNYVAKSGNNFSDYDLNKENKVVLHDSDIYGSLMFRDGKTSEDYHIMIGFDNNDSLIRLNNPRKSDKGIEISSNDRTTYSENCVSLGNFNFINSDNVDNHDYLYLTHKFIHNAEPYHKNKNLFRIGVDTVIAPHSYSDGLDIEDGINNKLHTIFNKEEIRFKYNNDSLIDVRCNDEVSRISFGEYETSPMFIDYDTKEKDLSINDKLGSIGVVKFCDGQCVDENETYKNDHAENDIPYNYTDSVVPKEYSEVIAGQTLNSPNITSYKYLDDSSDFGNFVIIDKNEKENFSSKYIYIANDMNQNTEGIYLRELERRYGFCITENGTFTPDAGAYDMDLDGNFSEKTGHEYIEVYSWDGENYIPTKTYNYLCIRFEVSKDLYGKKILINRYSNYIEYLNRLSNYTGNASNYIDTTKLNAYFCTDKRETNPNPIYFGFNKKNEKNEEIPPIENVDTIVEYTRVSDIIKYNNLSNENCIIDIPKMDGKLYFVMSFHLSVFTDHSYGRIDAENADRIYYPGLLTPSQSNKETFRDIYGFNYADISHLFCINPTKYTINKDDIKETETIQINNDTYYHHKLKDNLIKQQGFDTVIVPYNCDIIYDYTTSKSYKSFRIHGFFSSYKVKLDYEEPALPPPPEEDSKYKRYRLIYNVGFENSDIVIQKINNMMIDGVEIGSLYKLYRKDGKKIISSTLFGTISTPDAGPNPYAGYSQYFYIDNLVNPKVFFLSDTLYNDNDNIIDSNKYQNTTWYTFYTGDSSNNHRTLTYRSEQFGDNYWFNKGLEVTNTAGINFNVGQNKFNVNTDAYFNETLYANKIMFGEDDEFSTTIGSDLARFVYKDKNNKIKAITINENGIAFEKDPDDVSDEDVILSKTKETSFNGLTVSGDFKADRVFNAVYNDYADNLKCSHVSEYEPGDIICKDPHSNEYVLSTYDLRNLVVGVYSDTYGHLLGGDKDKSMSENSKNYVPVALAGNVRVKVKGLVNIGDLIEASNTPGVGQSAKNPQLGTIIGKALESKDNCEVDRILMQVMLL